MATTRLKLLERALWTLSLASIASCALSSISTKGTKLYDNDGNQFYVKGVAYSGDPSSTTDVLVDSDQCQIDAGLMNTLGVNTIRVYTVDATQNHDACMQAFDSQGIYVWLDLSTPLHAIDRTNPKWTADLYDQWTRTIDAFSGYNNVLFFTISNEVIMNEQTQGSAPFVKAATRDIKAFQAARGYRRIPIVYSASDVASMRALTAEYLSCGNDPDTAIDAYGMNLYSWCGNSSYYEAGYDTLYTQFMDSSIPVLFSETGCNAVTRDFSDVATMLGPVFQALFSGAVVYEWAESSNGYGIVNYNSVALEGFPGTLDDYNALKTVFSTATPTGTAMSLYTPSNSAPACPTTDSVWTVPGDAALPTIAELAISTVSRRTTLTFASSAASSATGSSTNGSSTAPPLESATRDAEPETLAGYQPDRQTSLSAGAIAGIAVGGAVLGIAAALGILFILWKRRKASQKAKPSESKTGSGSSDENHPLSGYSDEETQQTRTELPAKSAGLVIPRQEMDTGEFQHRGYYSASKPGDPIHEMGGGEMHEMDSMKPAGEIDGRPIVTELPGQR